MANATTRDTRAGFDIYRAAGGDISLDELNDRLVRAGYGPVARRSYDHFRSLADAGYNRYVSINRFDVARASVPYENASAMGRYDYRSADLGVHVVFAKGSKLLEAYGRALEVGEVGAMLHFEDEEVIEGLRKLKPQPGNMVTVRYLEVGRTVSGRVIDADLKSDPAVLEIEYARLVSIADVGVGEPLPGSSATYALRGSEDQLQTLDLVNRRLFHFFELLEGVRSVVNDAGARQDSPVYAEPPVLSSLSVASPAMITVDVAATVQLLLPAGLLAAVLRSAAAFPAKRKEWYEGTGQKLDNESKKIENRKQEIEVELKQLELDAEREEAELRSELVSRLRNALPDSSVSEEDAAALIDEHVLPPIRALGEIGIESVVDEDEDEDGAGATS